MIPFFTLDRENKRQMSLVKQAMNKTLKKKMFVLGDEVKEFEKEFAKYLGVKHCVGVGSGTDALILALHALGIGKGDEVITQANSFIATALAITVVGAKPVLVDVDPQTFQMNPREILKNITKKTKAIIPVHLYGSSCDMDELQQIAGDNDLFVLEDACQAHGSTYKKKKLGSLGILSAFSFYPTKNLGCYGDGGAVCTNSNALYEKLILLRNYGQKKKYIHETFGINSRLDEIQAAILRVKLRFLDSENSKRIKNVTLYKSFLSQDFLQKVMPFNESNYYIFSYVHKKRSLLQKYLQENGIMTLIHYPVPIHLQKTYTSLGYTKGDFPVSERLADTILSLPLFPGIKKSEIRFISKMVSDFRFHANH